MTEPDHADDAPDRERLQEATIADLAAFVRAGAEIRYHAVADDSDGRMRVLERSYTITLFPLKPGGPGPAL